MHNGNLQASFPVRSGCGWQGSGLHGYYSIYLLIQLGGGPGPGQCAGYDRYGFGLGPGVIALLAALAALGSSNLPAFVVDHCRCWQCVDNIILPLLAASALAQ